MFMCNNFKYWICELFLILKNNRKKYLGVKFLGLSFTFKATAFCDS